MSERNLTSELIHTNRMLVTGFDWGTRRVERFHQVIAGFAVECREQRADSARAYEFVRELGKELGETVNGALFMSQVAKNAPRS